MLHENKKPFIMEQKKNNKANLEKKRGIYSAIGLLMASTFVLAALEFRTIDRYEVCVFPENPFENEDLVESLLIYVPKAPQKPIVPITSKMRPDFILTDNSVDEPLEIIPIDVEIDNNLLASVDNLLIEEIVVEDEIPFTVVQKMPTFKGGSKGMSAFLRENIIYPHRAQREGKQGVVYVQFIVEKDGSLSHIDVLDDEPGSGCAQEAVRVINSMPNWNPGEQFGKKVRVKLTLPVNFRLN
jgi:protein TonB